jgi:ABC-type amino acid transport substrate-binding protein
LPVLKNVRMKISLTAMGKCLLQSAILFSLLAASFGVSPALAVKPEIVGTRTIISSTAKDFPPYYVIDKSGKPGGFAVEVLNEVAKRAGINVEYKIYKNGRELQRALMSRTIQVIPNISVSENREKYFIFTCPASTIRMSLFLRAKTRGIKSPVDLAGKLTGANLNSLGSRLLAQKNHKIIKGYKDPSSGIIALLSGEVDSFLYPEAVFWKRVNELRIADKVEVANVPIAQFKRAMIFTKQNFELRNNLDFALAEFLTFESYQKIYQKWFGTPIHFWTPLRISGDMGVVSVTDYGAGIPDEFQEYIFGRFTQVDSSDTREKGGTGLGLNISQSIIKKHNGIIGFNSEKDAGSTFFFKLPLAT